jgi:hypothetical protein
MKNVQFLDEDRTFESLPRQQVQDIPRQSSNRLSGLTVCANEQVTSHFGVHCMTSQRIPASIQRETCNILETLSNLLYVAEMEADDAQR